MLSFGLACVRIVSHGAPALDRAIALWMRRWARWSIRIAGLKLSIEDDQPSAHGALIIPNHTSYLDILVISAAAPVFYVPKAELLGWPAVGQWLRWLRQPCVVRRRTAGLAATAARIRELLKAGVSVCAFLEGTTTGGDRVLPFKPPLLQAAIDAGVDVRPAAIRYTAPAGVNVPDDVAYWRDHVFGPHIWRIFGLGGVEATVRLGEAIKATECPDRKALARRLRADVLDMTGLGDDLIES